MQGGGAAHGLNQTSWFYTNRLILQTQIFIPPVYQGGESPYGLTQKSCFNIMPWFIFPIDSHYIHKHTQFETSNDYFT